MEGGESTHVTWLIVTEWRPTKLVRLPPRQSLVTLGAACRSRRGVAETSNVESVKVKKPGHCKEAVSPDLQKRERCLVESPDRRARSAGIERHLR